MLIFEESNCSSSIDFSEVRVAGLISYPQMADRVFDQAQEFAFFLDLALKPHRAAG